jgi:hypothetical protein
MISTNTIPDVTYDVIEVEGNIAPAISWCIKTFGNPGNRWFISNDSFYFLQAKDATLFELRWCQ